MSCYWARFEQKMNNYFRMDTRVYLQEVNNPTDNDHCIGAVVGKNPGSALPASLNKHGLQKIDLNKDQLLPNIRTIFLKSFERANKPAIDRSYIQVLNLFYICDKDLAEAIKKIKQYKNNQIICEKEKQRFPFLWYLWGSHDNKLSIHKRRFIDINSDVHFYYNTNTQKVTTIAPGIKDPAKHTQGLKHELVIPYIAGIL